MNETTQGGAQRQVAEAIDKAMPRIVHVTNEVLSRLESRHPEIAGDPRLASEVRIRVGMAVAPLQTVDPMVLAGVSAENLRASLDSVLRASLEAVDPSELGGLGS
ncbi:MAG: hypothetical protein KC432_09595 [Thermomicrobiales bacterium]|nr:hypothetical protein [Thermomicrobiales bacterium]